MSIFMISTSFRIFLLIGAACSLSAQSMPPGAAEVLRDARSKTPMPPAASKSGLIPVPAEVTPTESKGGPSVLISSVILKGNTVFSASELQALLADKIGSHVDLAGMKAMARRISDFYRGHGYPFARALVPVQEFRDGVLEMRILEGTYDKVKAVGSPELEKGAAPYLAPLRPGDLLESGLLERTMLILDDVPGVALIPSVSPGSTVGTSSLDVAVSMNQVYGGDIGIDNAGSRYTGYYRGHASWYGNSLGTFGDRLAAMAMTTDLGMFLGSLDYEIPAGGSGLRWQIGYAHTTYALGKEYEVLGASGLAKVWSARLSYPLMRSQKANLSLSVGVQHRHLEDDFRTATTHEQKSTKSLPFSLRFDRRDGLLSGGVSYGMISYVIGDLSMDSNLLATDALTARKAGSYRKVNLDLARIQSFGENLSLYVRLSAQWANKNLDSSERLGMGGADAVRAYPLGEGAGDSGLFGQAEFRYRIGDYAPYFLYDAGSNRINEHPWDAGSSQRRTLSGAGFGVRHEHERWSSNVAIAYRIDGGPPNQDIGPAPYRIWFSLSRSF